ncbi:pyrimidine/purine nucleoside phosphorylase [Acinetobacter sp. SM34]|uniref:pyrimidine/purine nucleoside phosphorylase n=1 Tax=Acinetobacter sp. SM34 TaxID=1301620 RepID=UPI001EDB2B8D|nr:pyrimidine/purine nucleoside phosphorylase [Acinetobacter sp. SM34]MCG2608339.1 pyrimidine/purine nucleoside phosphorylase [Acinetobacter sp. SM34]
MSTQFNFVSVKKKSNIHFDGCSVSHVIELKDGTKKTIGVILPTERPLVFETLVAERIEIVSGKCLVQIGKSRESQTYHAGESFYVPKKTQFKIITDNIIDYVCHLEDR